MSSEKKVPAGLAQPGGWFYTLAIPAAITALVLAIPLFVSLFRAEM